MEKNIYNKVLITEGSGGSSVYNAKPASDTVGQGESIYFCNISDNYIGAIDVNTDNNNDAKKVAVNYNSLGVVLHPTQNKMYVAYSAQSKISIHDLTTSSSMYLSTLKIPSSIAITPDGSKVFVLEQFGKVQILDTATNTF